MASGYIDLPAVGARSWRHPVDTAFDLPIVNNQIGDVIVTKDTGIFYEWDGASWTTLTGGVTSLNSLTGALTIAGGTGISVTELGSTITISMTGASGITRVISLISSNTALAAAPLTDYVYLVSGTTTVTMPTAVSNTNRYTIKNIGVNTVTISTTSAQTIDGSISASMPVANSSLDLISDNSNWNVV